MKFFVVLVLAFLLSSSGKGSILDLFESFNAESYCRYLVETSASELRSFSILKKIRSGNFEDLGTVESGHLYSLSRDMRKVVAGTMYQTHLGKGIFSIGDRMLAVEGRLVRLRPTTNQLYIVPRDLESFAVRNFRLSGSTLRNTWMEAHFFPKYPQYKALAPLLNNYDGRWTRNWVGKRFYRRLVELRVNPSKYFQYEFSIEFSPDEVTIELFRQPYYKKTDTILPVLIGRQIEGEARRDPLYQRFLTSDGKHLRLTLTSAEEVISLVESIHRGFQLPKRSFLENY